MKRHDRIKALLRSDKYLADHRDLEKKIKSFQIMNNEERCIAKENLEIEFCAKWNVPEVYHPALEKYYLDECEKRDLEETAIEEVVSILDEPLREEFKVVHDR